MADHPPVGIELIVIRHFEKAARKWLRTADVFATHRTLAHPVEVDVRASAISTGYEWP